MKRYITGKAFGPVHCPLPVISHMLILQAELKQLFLLSVKLLCDCGLGCASQTYMIARSEHRIESTTLYFAARNLKYTAGHLVIKYCFSARFKQFHIQLKKSKNKKSNKQLHQCLPDALFILGVTTTGMLA